jgi:hypothetical protein
VSAPKAPEGVRVTRADGPEQPLSVRYDGFRDGAHHWLVDGPVDMLAGDRISVAVFPAHTALIFDREVAS